MKRNTMLLVGRDLILAISILIMARTDPIRMNEMPKPVRQKRLVYTINALIQNGLISESITRDEEAIPRVTLYATEKGLRFLEKCESSGDTKVAEYARQLVN